MLLGGRDDFHVVPIRLLLKNGTTWKSSLPYDMHNFQPGSFSLLPATMGAKVVFGADRLATVSAKRRGTGIGYLFSWDRLIDKCHELFVQAWEKFTDGALGSQLNETHFISCSRARGRWGTARIR